MQETGKSKRFRLLEMAVGDPYIKNSAGIAPGVAL